MVAKIVWRHEAKADLVTLLNEIAEKDPKAALKYIEDIEISIEKLADFPEQASRYNDVYRMLVVRKHLVFYRYEKDVETIFIINVIYGGRDLEELIGNRE